MHSITFVLLRPPFDDVLAAATALLRQHVLNEEAYQPSWRLDYWTTGDGRIADPETAAALDLTGDEDLGRNVCFVARLDGRCTPSAIVTPDGRWHDLFDFGWRFSPVETPENRAAWEQWTARVAEILTANADCLAIELDTHS